MRFVSYAQNFEDVILWRSLKHVTDGFYIDIGAQDPVVDSVSLGFHLHGWQGIHVEPIPRRAPALRRARPGDLVLATAIGEHEGSLRFFEFLGADGLSTCDEEIAEVHRAEGFTLRETEVPCLPLSKLFDRHVHREVHWLKIDVESFEGSVIRSWRPSMVRPWVVVVESTQPRTQTDASGAWEADLLALGYSFVYFDGLNRFYLSEAHPELASSFTCGPNVFDDFVLRPGHAFSAPQDAASAVPHHSLSQPVGGRSSHGLRLTSLLPTQAKLAIRRAALYARYRVEEYPVLRDWIMRLVIRWPYLHRHLRRIATVPAGAFATAARLAPHQTPDLAAAPAAVRANYAHLVAARNASAAPEA